MMTKIQRAAWRFIVYQVGFVTLLSIGLAVFTTPLIAYSALLGGSTCILPNGLFAFLAFRDFGARRAKQIVKNFYRGEALKLVLTILMFALVFNFVKVAPLPFFGVFILLQLSFWFAPLVITTRDG